MKPAPWADRLLKLGSQYASLLSRDGNSQERRRNRGGILAWAFVLTVEQDFQFLLQIIRPAVLFGRFKGIHGWPIIFSESLKERNRRAGEVEGIGVSGNRYICFRNSGAFKSLGHVILDSPRHRADKTFRRG